jgi:hypothetical protein
LKVDTKVYKVSTLKCSHVRIHSLMHWLFLSSLSIISYFQFRSCSRHSMCQDSTLVSKPCFLCTEPEERLESCSIQEMEFLTSFLFMKVQI